jgi:hypothetical protein
MTQKDKKYFLILGGVVGFAFVIHMVNRLSMNKIKNDIKNS